MSHVRNERPLPSKIADISVPQDAVSVMTWGWAQRSLPTYLLAHSVRAYCWGAVIAARENWAFDRLFVRAIKREVAVRPTCQSARLLNQTGLEAWMARSRWARG